MTAMAGPAAAPELLDELARRAQAVDVVRLDKRLGSAGYCVHPVRLKGHIEVCDGHGRRRVWSTDDEPDGILRKACGNRREAVCAPCAERYRQDAYHLIAPARWQGRPRHGDRAPGGVHDADGAELRPGPHRRSRPGL
jgi:hypothetical protein